MNNISATPFLLSLIELPAALNARCMAADAATMHCAKMQPVRLHSIGNLSAFACQKVIDDSGLLGALSTHPVHWLP